MLPPRAMVTLGSPLLLGFMSGFVSLPQPQSVLMLMAPVATESSEDRATQLVLSLTNSISRESRPYPCLGSPEELSLSVGEQMSLS